MGTAQQSVDQVSTVLDTGLGEVEKLKLSFLLYYQCALLSRSNNCNIRTTTMCYVGSEMNCVNMSTSLSSVQHQESLSFLLFSLHNLPEVAKLSQTSLDQNDSHREIRCIHCHDETELFSFGQIAHRFFLLRFRRYLLSKDRGVEQNRLHLFHHR